MVPPTPTLEVLYNTVITINIQALYLLCILSLMMCSKLPDEMATDVVDLIKLFHLIFTNLFHLVWACIVC